MLFNETWGIKDFDPTGDKVFSRRAVRAIIFDDDQLLLIKTKLGDYKLPGGGIKVDEEPVEALIREVEEETGYTINKVLDQSGIIVERNIDKFEENALFEMISFYYLCQISGNNKEQQLEDYERGLNFKSVWVGLQDAIQQNESLLTGSRNQINEWVARETKVFKILRDLRSTDLNYAKLGGK